MAHQTKGEDLVLMGELLGIEDLEPKEGMVPGSMITIRAKAREAYELWAPQAVAEQLRKVSVGSQVVVRLYPTTREYIKGYGNRYKLKIAEVAEGKKAAKSE
jgi:hypothetical protein